MPFDHRLAGSRGTRFDHVATRIVVALATRDCVPGRFVPGNLPGELVAAAVGGDDGGKEGFVHGRNTKNTEKIRVRIAIGYAAVAV